MLVKTKFVRRFLRHALRGAVLFCVAGAPVIAGAQPVSHDPDVPVTVTKAVRQNVPIWLRGLGTVQANYAVQLRPRVDGTLTQVPVKEGQQVKKGDLLAVIDPRPYQAILDAAAAKKQQDRRNSPTPRRISRAMPRWSGRTSPHASSTTPSRRW
jgi:multidrug efflux system membrane fusion protein